MIPEPTIATYAATDLTTALVFASGSGPSATD